METNLDYLYRIYDSLETFFYRHQKNKFNRTEQPEEISVLLKKVKLILNSLSKYPQLSIFNVLLLLFIPTVNKQVYLLLGEYFKKLSIEQKKNLLESFMCYFDDIYGGQNRSDLGPQSKVFSDEGLIVFLDFVAENLDPLMTIEKKQEIKKEIQDKCSLRCLVEFLFR